MHISLEPRVRAAFVGAVQVILRIMSLPTSYTARRWLVAHPLNNRRHSHCHAIYACVVGCAGNNVADREQGEARLTEVVLLADNAYSAISGRERFYAMNLVTQKMNQVIRPWCQ